MRIRSSALILVAVNLIPIAGVLLFDWRVFDILMLYWVENLVIGVVNVMRMVACSKSVESGVFGAALDSVPDEQRVAFSKAGSFMRLILIPFFVLHYGMFCFGHLSAIMFSFAPDSGRQSAYELFFGQSFNAAILSPLWIGVAAISASHLYSFFSNFLGGGEYTRVSLTQMMQRPYGRIIALHVAIIAGGALVQYLGAPVYMLVVLVIVKTSMDLQLHRAERRKFSTLA